MKINIAILSVMALCLLACEETAVPIVVAPATMRYSLESNEGLLPFRIKWFNKDLNARLPRAVNQGC